MFDAIEGAPQELSLDGRNRREPRKIRSWIHLRIEYLNMSLLPRYSLVMTVGPVTPRSLEFLLKALVIASSQSGSQ